MRCVSMFMKKMLLGLAVLPSLVLAKEEVGISFYHHDWEIACDNTRNCRAVGYQSDDGGENLPLALLLERAAGANQPVTSRLMLGDRSEDNITPPAVLTMKVNNQSLGKVTLNKEDNTGKLSFTQTTALLAALRRDSTIEWLAGKDTWILSDKGASAVLLKMDEFQGRLGTKGALVKKGNLDESNVLPPLPMPIIISPKLPKTLDADKAFLIKNEKAIRHAIEKIINNDDDNCEGMYDYDKGGFEKQEIKITRLNQHRFLVSTFCWRAAYNEGHGYWIIDNKPPYNPKLITTSASGDSAGGIYSTQKGRGIGDCWSTDTWTWNGKDFVHSASSTTGMCKMVAAGGAWQLPTIVTEVRETKP